jgi:hypothetical protein
MEKMLMGAVVLGCVMLSACADLPRQATLLIHEPDRPLEVVEFERPDLTEPLSFRYRIVRQGQVVDRMECQQEASPVVAQCWREHSGTGR